MFFRYRQNNSGGSFVTDHGSGISQEVYVEADTPYEADDIAERIGIYFDGFGDCSCCGNRWYRADDYDVAYRPPISVDGYFKWITDGPAGYVHYKSGMVVPLDYAEHVC